MAVRLHQVGRQGHSPGRGQFGEALQCPGSDLGIDTGLEAGRRLTAQTQAAGRAGDVGWIPPCGFEQHHVGAPGDLRGGTTHHAGDADWPVRSVGDHAVAGAEGAHDTVEGLDLLALGGAAHPQ